MDLGWINATGRRCETDGMRATQIVDEAIGNALRARAVRGTGLM
jgi:hypothetical protein